MKNLICFVVLLASLASCKSSAPIKDYDMFYELQPKTILVLPVTNETTSAEAPAAFQSTIASPLIQRGYYVLPVLPTINIMQAEGIYEGEQLQNVPPQRFGELLGADAVLYITLHSWDTTYMVLASGVSVSMTYKLVDTTTGEQLWIDTATRTVQSDTSGGLLGALINAAITAMSTEYIDLASQANSLALVSLPSGVLSDRFERDRTKYVKQ